MNKSRVSYSFLMEMLWVCGFFALAACIFVLAFVKADQLSREADSLNHAVLEAQNALETTFSSSDASPFSSTEELFFDRNWNQIQEGDKSPSFRLRLTALSENGMLYVTADVTDKNGSAIYSLSGERCTVPERSIP